MWNISLYCPKCKTQLQYGGIYPKAREVVDVESRYYLIGADYPRFGKCKIPACPWSPDVINQLDPYHRNLFPAVLTKNDALDKKCVTLMKPRTLGNSSSFIKQAIHEIHSENWVTTQTLSTIPHPSQKTSQQSADSVSNVVTTQTLSTIPYPSQKTSQQSANSVSHTTESASTSIECGLCKKSVPVETYHQHLSEWHADIKCDQCGSGLKGERALANHMKDFHTRVSKPLSSEEAIKEKVLFVFVCLELNDASTLVGH